MHYIHVCGMLAVCVAFTSMYKHSMLSHMVLCLLCACVMHVSCVSHPWTIQVAILLLCLDSIVTVDIILSNKMDFSYCNMSRFMCHMCDRHGTRVSRVPFKLWAICTIHVFSVTSFIALLCRHYDCRL